MMAFTIPCFSFFSFISLFPQSADPTYILYIIQCILYSVHNMLLKFLRDSRISVWLPCTIYHQLLSLLLFINMLSTDLFCKSPWWPWWRASMCLVYVCNETGKFWRKLKISSIDVLLPAPDLSRMGDVCCRSYQAGLSCDIQSHQHAMQRTSE